jgi:vacuolar-type H+-ATPase subunit I/STV1
MRSKVIQKILDRTPKEIESFVDKYTDSILIKNEILEAKRKLYESLLKLDKDMITDDESDLIFILSKDESIKK